MESLTRQGFRSRWPETISGHSGSDIARALSLILRRLTADNPAVYELTLWSESCMPQNRNKIMSTTRALLLQNTHVIKRWMSSPKNSERANFSHSDIQEIDNLHCHLQKWLQQMRYTVLLAWSAYSTACLVKGHLSLFSWRTKTS